MGFCPLQRAPAELTLHCCAPNSITGRRDAACLQHQLRLLIAGEGLAPLTDRANQAKETAFQCERLWGEKDLEQIFQNCQKEAGTSFPSLLNGERQQTALQNLRGN